MLKEDDLAKYIGDANPNRMRRKNVLCTILFVLERHEEAQGGPEDTADVEKHTETNTRWGAEKGSIRIRTENDTIHTQTFLNLNLPQLCFFYMILVFFSLYSF